MPVKSIEVSQILEKDPAPALELISDYFDRQGEEHRISVVNWKEFDYSPEVKFTIAYGMKEIFIKYYVKERYFKAEKTETNQMVCEDSCVEFFAAPSGDGLYYNVEFNAIGTCLMGYGTSRHDSKRAPVSVIDSIRRLPSAGTVPLKEITGDISWTLTLAIPFSVFFKHNTDTLKGKTISANFYKCGDMLSKPHYLTWNPVGTKKPDYHRPEFFGLLKFI